MSRRLYSAPPGLGLSEFRSGQKSRKACYCFCAFAKHVTQVAVLAKNVRTYRPRRFNPVLAKRSSSITASRPVRCTGRLDGLVGHLEAVPDNVPSTRGHGRLRIWA